MRIAALMLMMLVTFCGCARSRSGTAIKESSPLQAGQPDPERDMTNLMNISQAIQQYASDHGGQLPSSLGQTLTYIQPRTAWTKESQPKWTAKELATLYISPRDLKGKSLPENPDATWIDANTSYVYLGQGGSKLPKDADWGKTVIVHAKVSEGYDVVGPERRIVRVVPVAMLDGHAEAEAVPHTEALIADSSKLLRP